MKNQHFSPRATLSIIVQNLTQENLNSGTLRNHGFLARNFEMLRRQFKGSSNLDIAEISFIQT